MSSFTEDTIRTIVLTAPGREAFYESLLKLVADETGANSAVAWDCNVNPLRPISQVHRTANQPVRLGFSQTAHSEILLQATKAAKSLVVHPKPAPHVPDEQNPVILIGKIPSSTGIELIELFVPNGASDDEYKSKTQILEDICDALIGMDFSSAIGQQAPLPPKRISPMQLDEYVHQIHRSLDPKETAVLVSNEARRILDCDRVSVLEVKGKRCKVTAVSGQPSVNNRSNTIYLLRKLAQKVLWTKQTFWYPTEKQLPVEIEKPLHEYLGLAATRSMVICPVYDQPPRYEERPDPVPLKRELIGGIVIEKCSEEWTQDSVNEAVDIVTRHASDSIRNAHNHRQLLFYSVWKWLGKSKIVLAARNLPKTIAATTGLVALSLIMALWPASLKVSCDGVLIPELRSRVFVPVDGTVSKILVKHGAKVKKGEILIKLENLELETRSAELNGKIDELEQNIRSTETLLLSRVDEDQQLSEQTLNAQKEELKSLRRQHQLVLQKIEKLDVASPRDGQVVTWNIVDRFERRPVSRGEQLMEIVDVEGDWQLELNLTDPKVGHVLEAAKQNENLEVEFILAADPERKFKGQVIEIGKATELTSDQNHAVPIRVKIESAQLDIRQAKSGVSANIVCEETSLGYSLFHGVQEFFQKQWFKLF